MRDQNRVFGLLMAGALGVIAILQYIWNQAFHFWLIGLGLLLLIIGLGVPSWLGPVRLLWMKFARGLGVVNTRILLTLIFTVMITPLALLLRVLGRQPIKTEVSQGVSSYWRPRHPEEFTAKRMERQF